MIKKVISLLVLSVMIISFAGCGQSTGEMTKVSNVIACINNYPIPSYMVGDECYIAVETLSYYGFDIAKSGSTYKISVKEKGEIEPEYYIDKIKYNDEKKVGTSGEKIKSSNASVVVNNEKIDSIEIGGSVCIPFFTLKLFTNGFTDVENVKKVYIDEIMSFAPNNEYKYIKLRSGNYDAEDFLDLNFQDIENAFGNDYTREFEDGLAKIVYNDKTLPVKTYYEFGENDSTQKMLSSSVKKIEYESENVIILDSITVGTMLSEAEKVVDNILNVYEDGDTIYAKYRVKKKFNIKFILEKENDDYKITKIIAEK